ncbi:TPA: DsbE family thiol:disulfide interchange protein [Vibrio vulnificus]
MNNKVIKLLVLVSIVGIVTFTAVLGIERQNAGHTTPATVIPLPNIDAKDLFSANTITTQDLISDQYRVMNVWASWCGICRDEHTFIMSLKQQGIDVIGLNYRDNKQEALGYLESEGNPYSKVIYDPDGIVSIDFGVIGTPETYLINPSGEIMIKFRGKLDQKQWNKHFATYFK